MRQTGIEVGRHASNVEETGGGVAVSIQDKTERMEIPLKGEYFLWVGKMYATFG